MACGVLALLPLYTQVAIAKNNININLMLENLTRAKLYVLYKVLKVADILVYKRPMFRTTKLNI